jgi:hypothetical protein
MDKNFASFLDFLYNFFRNWFFNMKRIQTSLINNPEHEHFCSANYYRKTQQEIGAHKLNIYCTIFIGCCLTNMQTLILENSVNIFCLGLNQ